MPAVDPKLLASVPLFRGLDGAGLAAVTADARLVRAAAGPTFFREGDAAADERERGDIVTQMQPQHEGRTRHLSDDGRAMGVRSGR